LYTLFGNYDFKIVQLFYLYLERFQSMKASGAEQLNDKNMEILQIEQNRLKSQLAGGKPVGYLQA